MIKLVGCLAVVIAVCYAVTDKQFNELVQKVNNLEKSQNNKVAQLEKSYKTKTDDLQKKYNARTAQFVALARQVSLQQLYVEEMSRSTGDSGVKLARLIKSGSKPYFSTSYTGTRLIANHDHADFKNTVGLGELIAVLNGVEFRTRHNDYKLVMPSKTSKQYQKTEPIPFPEVPPAVLAKPTIELQIKEMKEWFNAWLNSDTKKRDYRKYFQANLCYLEGMWTESKSGAIEEPFASDRHAIDAKSFFDLQEKIRFTSNTGRKSLNENYSYLPTTISTVDKFGNIKYSQWNYDILCHPLKTAVPLTRFRLEDDLASRVSFAKNLDDFAASRAARFSLYEDFPDNIKFNKRDMHTREYSGNFLDRLMAEIPGKDNYLANVTDGAFGQFAYPRDSVPSQTPKPKPLNVGFYHRGFKYAKGDAMGTASSRRGFNDANLYVAYNTQSKITPTKVTNCVRNYKCSYVNSKAKKCNYHTCTDYIARVSYAIPLEIVYTTPLQSWNPYNLTYYQDKNLVETKNTNGEYKRKGEHNIKDAYAGITFNKYYMTPSLLYEETKAPKDSADTAKFARGVLDPQNRVRSVSASGIHVLMRKIPDVGIVRTRYPIMPLHDDGNSINKNLQALKDMTLQRLQYSYLYPTLTNSNGTLEEAYTFETTASNKYPEPGLHTHEIELTESDIKTLKAGGTITAQTSTDNGHNHEMLLKLNSNHYGKYIQMIKCDGQKYKCWDGHAGRVFCHNCRYDPIQNKVVGF